MSYEFDGEKYKNASKHQKEWGNAIIEELDIKEDFKILDLGCGDGILTQKLSECATKGMVIGIDASEGMINTSMSLNNEHLKFIKMDINHMQFEADTFDLIFSNAALHWVKNHDKLLNDCLKLLKKGGKIRFNFAADGNCRNFFEVSRKLISGEKYKKYFKDFKWPWYMPKIDEYFEKINTIAGYTDVKVYEKNADRYFSNEEEMIGWIDQPSIVPFLPYLPEGIKDEFRNDIIKEMLERTKCSDGRCFEEFKRINVCGKKR